MAVTKIWKIMGRAESPLKYIDDPSKTENPFTEEERQALTDVIQYAANEKKTEKRFFTTGINCSSYCARDQFATAKKRFGKEDGIVAFHAYQSFAKGETTPEEAHEIGVQLAKTLWGDRFQVLVATHLNTDCLHNHFVINSVSFRDGKRFHDCRDTYRELREASDRICAEHGLSVIMEPQGRRVPMYLYKMEQAGMPTRYNVARQAIDESIRMSVNLQEFKAEMKARHYVFRFDETRKYWTVTPPGWEKPIRTHKLGPDYTKERLLERIYEKDVSEERAIQVKHVPNGYRLRRRFDRIWERSGLEKLYLRYCYELGYLPKYTQNPGKLEYLMKEELLKCEKYSDEAKLLAKNRISTNEDLSSFRESLISRIKETEEARNELRAKAKRLIPEKEKEEIRKKVKELTGVIKTCRAEIKLCDDIEKRSPVVEKNLEEVQRMKMERQVFER